MRVAAASALYQRVTGVARKGPEPPLKLKCLDAGAGFVC